MKSSTLTFRELTKNLSFVKIIYNGEIIYNDYDSDNETFEHLKQITTKYANKKVYSMKITIVNFHHCILYIKGER